MSWITHHGLNISLVVAAGAAWLCAWIAIRRKARLKTPWDVITYFNQQLPLIRLDLNLLRELEVHDVPNSDYWIVGPLEKDTYIIVTGQQAYRVTSVTAKSLKQKGISPDWGIWHTPSRLSQALA